MNILSCYQQLSVTQAYLSKYQNSQQKHQYILKPTAVISNNSKIIRKYQQFSAITVKYQ